MATTDLTFLFKSDQELASLNDFTSEIQRKLSNSKLSNTRTHTSTPKGRHVPVTLTEQILDRLTRLEVVQTAHESQLKELSKY